MGLLEVAQTSRGADTACAPVDDGVPDPEDMARYVEGIADPERPVGMEAFAALELSGQAPRLTLGANWQIGRRASGRPGIDDGLASDTAVGPRGPARRCRAS